jgi:serine phosphatase RsbU (regulator of sigma subunit)
MPARTTRRRQQDGLYHVAHTLQRSLLPDALPALEGIELASVYRPADRQSEAGGDFYDVFLTPSGCWLVIGDVCGKGVEAAAVTAIVRHSIRALAFREHSPAQVLATVNDVMLSHDLAGRFATAAVARIERLPRADGDPGGSDSDAVGLEPDPGGLDSDYSRSDRDPSGLELSDSDRLYRSLIGQAEELPRARLSRPRHRRAPFKAILANAGHPALILLDQDGAAHCPPTAGALLGALPHPALTDVELALHPGSTLVFYTDGLTEAGAPARTLQTHELCEQLAGRARHSPQALARRLEKLAIANADGRLRDDVAILTARLQ